MKYRKGFKYQIAEELILQTSFRPESNIYSDFCCLTMTGELLLRRGFAWDGASGPVVDRKSNMIAGAGHDGLYRLMRKGLLDHNLWPEADAMFAKWLKDNGAWALTIKIDSLGLKIANGAAANPSNIAKIYEV